jgi:hypothetical protein
VSSNNEFVFQGIDALLAQLRTLPADLAAAAAWYVEDSAAAAEAEVRAVYQAHRVTGDLADKLTRDTSASAFGTAVRVRNPAKHAWIFENGTQARHYTSKRGTRHDTGAMWGHTPQPPTHVFIPTMQKHRRRMYERLSEMVERFGLEVRETP